MIRVDQAACRELMEILSPLSWKDFLTAEWMEDYFDYAINSPDKCLFTHIDIVCPEPLWQRWHGGPDPTPVL